MMTFWISQQAGAVDGPYELDQLGHLYRSGSIVATAQVCEVGKEEWRPISELRRCFPAAFSGASPAPSSGRDYNVGVYRLLALFFGFIGVHNFYAGEVASGFWKFLFVFLAAAFSSVAPPLSTILVILLFVWVIVEIANGHEIQHSTDKAPDTEEMRAADAAHVKRSAWLTLAVAVGIIALIFLISFLASV